MLQQSILKLLVVQIDMLADQLQVPRCGAVAASFIQEVWTNTLEAFVHRGTKRFVQFRFAEVKRELSTFSYATMYPIETVVVHARTCL